MKVGNVLFLFSIMVKLFVQPVLVLIEVCFNQNALLIPFQSMGYSLHDTALIAWHLFVSDVPQKDMGLKK